MPTTRTRPATRSTRRTGPRSAPDAIALIKADHATVSSLFDTYEALGPRAVRRKRQVAERVIKELSIHTAIEEELLYPLAKDELPNGPALVKQAKQEHGHLKRLLRRLDQADPEDPKTEALMASVRDAVLEHVAEEEGNGGILPGLRKAMRRADLVELGRELRRAKRTAPTRPETRSPARRSSRTRAKTATSSRGGTSRARTSRAARGRPRATR